MGRPGSETSATPAAKRRALRVLLSALAGSGLTAAGLAGPLATNAFSFEAQPAGTPTGTTAQETPASEPATTTSTTETSTTPSATPETTTQTTTTSAPITTGTTTAPAPPATEAPPVVLQKKQQPSAPKNKATTTTAKGKKVSSKKGSGANNVAESPQIVADQAALEAILGSGNASDEALQFYRIPLFLLPIYKAAAVQYGVPWQILAAINEIETDYGTDQSVSTAGALGWMQFMPATWLQYGVDALNAGYADPYNPVDAIFAAARYLRAAGAAANLKHAIFAYNHSEEYVASVLLRAKLIATYPQGVIATLTGLIDGRLPVTGRELSWTVPATPGSTAAAETGSTTSPLGASSATAGATQVSPTDSSGTTAASSATTATAPSPEAAASGATPSGSTAAGATTQVADLTTGPEASIVAVQDGRVIAMGQSPQLGTYIKLRDVNGDTFTYAGLGGLARTYAVPKTDAAAAQKTVVEAASTSAPTPKGPASAGTQRPVTLPQTSAPAPDSAGTSSGQVTIAPVGDGVPAGMNRVRLYAHPKNPDAKAAAVARAAERARSASSRQRLGVGSVVTAGTVLGRVLVTSDGASGHLRFELQPAGDSASIDPGPVLANWAELQDALHPQGARATNPLLGATASDVLLLSQSELERAVLSDPEIEIYKCGRQDITAGLVSRRVLAAIAFLARSGLEPTVSALRCGQDQYTAAGALSAAYDGDSVSITAINGVPIARHQGAGTITDLTIRTLLTLPSQFVPSEIVSLMRYPGSPETRPEASHWNRLELVFAPPSSASATAASAHTVHHARKAASALAAQALTRAQWNELMTHVAALPFPSVSTKRSAAAISDPKKRPSASARP